jgi:uncharacterized protein
MSNRISRRKFLGAAGTIAAGSLSSKAHAKSPLATVPEQSASSSPSADRIIDMHVHFDEASPTFISDLLKLCGSLNFTACVLTPFSSRKIVAEAARKNPSQIIPFGYVDLDARDVVQQVEEFHTLGYRGLGELEFVKKPFNDPSYFPVYELANRYAWIVLFHTGIVLRKKFDKPEDVASGRMRPVHLEEIARRFPKITVLGAHCGNPEYEWAAEIARWNPNVFFDLSGSSLTKMRERLADFRKIFWWSGSDWKTNTPDQDPSAYSKIVFGSDVPLSEIESVVRQYQAMFDACEVPPHTRRMIMGGTMAKILKLPA